MLISQTRFKTIYIGIIFLSLPAFVSADFLNQSKEFFVDPTYDSAQREEVWATLKKISQNTYFYLEDEWYRNLSQEEKEKTEESLDVFGQEFDQKIYPQLTSIFGQEWAPGIDDDYHITILFQRLRKEVGGYFNNGDEYPKIQNPKSNEREMLYLNAEFLFSPITKSYLAHEFTHLITFNQKERLRHVEEEVWLNEARAELAPTFLGYDDQYQKSNLQHRIKQFISSPSDSLTEWRDKKEDYGVTNLFFQYFLDHYGIGILAHSLKSSKTGIESIDEALRKNHFEKNFSQIFVDWTIALFLNDCHLGEKYCYRNENLRNLRITPTLIFLPPAQKAEASFDYSIKQWSGHWYRVFGGKGDLKLKFQAKEKIQFKIPYVLCKDSEDCQVEFLNLDSGQKGEILLSDFGKNWTSLTIIPSIQERTSGFSEKEPFHPFSLTVLLGKESEKEKLIKQILAQIEFLKKEIARARADALSSRKQRKEVSCPGIEKNLFYGLTNNPQVKCLQKFLKAQGREIYPEGLVTGYFGPLTHQAVIRFQERYKEEILAPWGIEKGTGFVGRTTRAKINSMLSKP